MWFGAASKFDEALKNSSASEDNDDLDSDDSESTCSDEEDSGSDEDSLFDSVCGRTHEGPKPMT